MRRLARLTLLSLALACTSAAFAHGVQPATPVRTLAIGGAVERPLKLDAQALRQRPAAQFTEVRLTDKQGKTGTVRGIRLRDLLNEAGIVSRDHNTVKKLAIIATAADQYAVVFSWNELFNASAGDKVLVVLERDGKPLPDTEGPLALVSADDLRTGPRHVKWLQSIDVRQLVD